MLIESLVSHSPLTLAGFLKASKRKKSTNPNAHPDPGLTVFTLDIFVINCELPQEPSILHYQPHFTAVKLKHRAVNGFAHSPTCDPTHPPESPAALTLHSPSFPHQRGISAPSPTPSLMLGTAFQALVSTHQSLTSFKLPLRNLFAYKHQRAGPVLSSSFTRHEDLASCVGINRRPNKI